MDNISLIFTTSLFFSDLAIRIGLSLRVIMRKGSASVSLAWLVVILLVPFFGAITYLLLGENRIGERRAARAAADLPLIHKWFDSLKTRIHVDWNTINPECEPLRRQIDATIGIPAMPDNRLELIAQSTEFFTRLIADIDQARSSCFLEFYIWQPGGMANQIAEALLRAQKRGVICRILLDSIGSKNFFRSSIASTMRQQGIEIVEALPAGIFRALFVRIDLRNHRKICTIDGEIAYTGSHNLVDPKFFKQEEGVGQWIDTMVRVQGPVVEVITASFMYDWLLETDKRYEDFRETADVHPVPSAGKALVQLAPSGPGYGEETIHNLLLTTIYAARKELTMTTPYFVPDNAILAALKSAALRGVNVTILVPKKIDSKLVHYASQARYVDLCSSGVKIMAFSKGLLHTKTVTVDGDFSLFGSVNLDMRSFWLNFEMTLFVYNREFTAKLRAVNDKYMQNAEQLDEAYFAKRTFFKRLLENCALLLGPLL